MIINEKLRVKSFYSAVCGLVLLTAQAVFCQVKLPALISDGMVLQRDANVKIWGWADSGEKVTINFNGKTYKTASQCGRQMVGNVFRFKSRRPIQYGY